MKRPHILVVEDEAEMRETLSDILSEGGYEVKTTGKGKEALALAMEEKEKFPFAICLIDLKLPDIDGIKVLEEIKHINPGAYAIIMTAFASKDTAIEALKAGAYSYIEKPVNIEELLHVIKKATESYQLLEEKKRVEEELKKNEEKLKNIFASVTDGITATDLNANIIDCNQATVDMYGFSSREEMIGRSAFDFIVPKDRKRAKENAMKTLKQGFLKNLEFTCLTKEGHEFPVLMSPSVLRDSYGNPAAFVAVTKDVTERKRAEKELKESRKFLETVIENIPDTITLRDSEHRVVLVNQAYCNITGVAKHEVIGKKGEYKETNDKVFQTGNVLDIPERTYTDTEGKRHYVSVKKTPLRDESGKITHVLTISRDITEHKRMDEELERYTKELERANRDLEDFTSTVSHDLKAPLRSIQAFSTLLLEDYADMLDETGRGYLNRVKEAVERMVMLIEDLLKLSRVGRKFTEVEAVDLDGLIEEIKSDLSARIEDRGGEVVVVGKLPTLSTQRVWMKELFMNLIDNGLKFNRAEKPRVEVSCEGNGENYLFRVKDNGIGIEERDQANIFNLFEKLHSRSEYEGTGAGLAICKKIVEELGGTIWVESKPGEGSTFLFVIPGTEKNLHS